MSQSTEPSGFTSESGTAFCDEASSCQASSWPIGPSPPLAQIPVTPSLLLTKVRSWSGLIVEPFGTIESTTASMAAAAFWAWARRADFADIASDCSPSCAGDSATGPYVPGASLFGLVAASRLNWVACPWTVSIVDEIARA